MIDETVEEISEMQTHSSSVVAVKAAQALRVLTDREFPTVEDYIRTLDRNSSALRRANPSHASLHTTQHRIVTAVSDADPDDVATAKELTIGAIEEVIEAVESATDEIDRALERDRSRGDGDAEPERDRNRSDEDAEPERESERA